MKQTFLLFLSAVLLFSSCKKKDDTEPEAKPVEIGGKSYPTVKIGTQTWTTVNYNGSGGINYASDPNDPAVGKLYSYSEAVAITGLPDGWKVPTEADVKKLMATIGTETDPDGDLYINEAKCRTLISTSGWDVNGDNESGFNIKPTGFYYSQGGVTDFVDKGISGSFWTTSRRDDNVLYLVIGYDIWDGHNNSFRAYIDGTTRDGGPTHPTFVEKRSIRFVKDN